jgi:hypothetical protein
MPLAVSPRLRAAVVIALLLGAGPAAAVESVSPVPTTRDLGASGRDARRRALAAVPLDRLPEADRRAVEKCLRSHTIHRRLPVETVTCDAELVDFVLTRPEVLVDVWRVLGISRLSLDPTGPRQWRLADGYGTVGTVRLLHHERWAAGGVLVFHGRGGYTGPLSPRDLTGSCLVIVRHAPAPADADGRPRQAVQIDAFLDVDGLGLELVTRALQPLIIHSAAANLHEIALFVSQFAAAAERNPAAVARLAGRMSRTAPEDRRALVELAAGNVADSASDEAEDVQASLAARWMPVEQLDALRR